MTLLVERPAPLRLLAWLVALAWLALASGCAPDIGDKCTVSTDCSVTGDRLCDSTQPNGYCTVFNCEPNACPDDSICVAFKEPTCATPAQSVRFTRTFCMATCESNEDCRAGYTCFEVSASDETRQVLDIDPATRRICTVPPTPPLVSSDVEPAVCNAFDGSLPESAAPAGDASDSAPDATGDANIDVVIDPSLEAGDSAD